ncbi:MAG: hypothetical protein MZV65_17340 [Chromatiales bacterium]|nr:hypothetical protein [Chromatiales bacterium]
MLARHGLRSLFGRAARSHSAWAASPRSEEIDYTAGAVAQGGRPAARNCRRCGNANSGASRPRSIGEGIAMNLQEQRLSGESDSRPALGRAGHPGSGVRRRPGSPTSRKPDFGGFLLHLSTLAGHTRNLLAHPARRPGDQRTGTGTSKIRRRSRG